MKSLSRRAFLALIGILPIGVVATMLAAAFAIDERRWIVAIWGICVVAALSLLYFVRVAAYRAVVPYDARRDYTYDFSKWKGGRFDIALDPDGFLWPQTTHEFDTALLVFDSASTALGKYFDPWVEVSYRGNTCRQTLERGVRGRRILNLLAIVNQPPESGEKVSLRGHRLCWRREATLLLCNNSVKRQHKVFIASPHPDDAEIAAFGLYGSCNTTIMTLCAGDAGSYAYKTDGANESIDSNVLRATVRVCESISVPLLAGVDSSRCFNLCYRDNSLADLYFARTDATPGSVLSLSKVECLRELNGVDAPFDTKRSPTKWNHLVDDLAESLRNFQPRWIVAPHPLLDSHLDHCYTTAAMLEAALAASLTGSQWLLYVIHPNICESHPLGPASSAVGPAPCLDQSVSVTGIYAHRLTAEQRCIKHLALEAMHDLRPQRLMPGEGVMGAFKEFMGRLFEAVSGCDRNPHDLFRRSVRPNELFFTMSRLEVEQAVQEFLADQASRNSVQSANQELPARVGFRANG